jgi:hypothetical protein
MNSFAFALDALKQEILSQLEFWQENKNPKQTQETK